MCVCVSVCVCLPCPMSAYKNEKTPLCAAGSNLMGLAEISTTNFPTWNKLGMKPDSNKGTLSSFNMHAVLSMCCVCLLSMCCVCLLSMCCVCLLSVCCVCLLSVCCVCLLSVCCVCLLSVCLLASEHQQYNGSTLSCINKNMASWINCWNEHRVSTTRIH